MPRFPTYQRQQGLGGGATASYASAGAFTAPARALQDLGGTISNLGDQFAAETQKVKNSQDDTWFSRARAETAMELQRFDREQQQSATGNAAGYQEAVKTQYATIRERHLGEAPSPRAMQMYDEWSQSYNEKVDTATGTFRAASELAKRNDDFASAMLAHTQSVFENPDSYDDVAKRVKDDLAGAAQWMTPEQEIEVRQKIERELQLAKAKGDIIRDPKAFLAKVGMSQDGKVNLSFSPEVDRAIASAASKYNVSADALRVIAQIESRGNPGAKNPTSSAGGLFQQIDKNARQYGVRDRFDANQSAEGAARFMRDNEIVLRAALGRVPTIGELYLAHQQGPGGARKLLTNPDARAVDIVGAQAVKLNGGHPDMTARQFANLWIKKAEKIAGEGGSPRPNFNQPGLENLGVNDLLSLSEEAQQRSNAIDRQSAADLKSSLASIKGSFELGIATGDQSVTQNSILQSPLADDDKASLINSLNSKRKDERMAGEALAKLGAGAGGFDPLDADERKGVSLAYDAATGGASLYGDDGKARAALAYIYDQSGIVPKRAMNEIRAGLVSGDASKVATAASLASYLAADNPAALGLNENGEALAKAAATYRHMTETLGLTSEEAGKRMVDLNDPEKQKQREALLESKQVKDAIKKITDSDVAAVFDTGLFDLAPQVGETEAAKASMTATYKDMYTESVVEAGGDLDLAKKLAADKFKRVFGETNLTQSGKDVVTRYPPELLLPPDSAGSYDWIPDQLLTEMKDAGIEAGKVYLQPRPDTKPGNAIYDVYYDDMDGKRQYLPGDFVPDPSRRDENGLAESREKFEENRQEMLDAPRPKPIPETVNPDPSKMQERFMSPVSGDEITVSP